VTSLFKSTTLAKEASITTKTRDIDIRLHFKNNTADNHKKKQKE